MKIFFKIILSLLFLWFVTHTVFIVFDGLTDELEKKKFALILGTTVHEDGQLSGRLEARLDAGLKLYEDSLVSKFFVSGGLGKEGYLEGSKMKEYLISKGVLFDHVIVDNKGNNTRLTAVNFVSSFPDEKSVVVISQFFHISRTKLALKQAGLKDVTGVHANFHEWRDVYSTFREFLGYYKYLLVY